MLADAWARVSGDPLLAYSLAAAAVLAVASLLSGWVRGDTRALTRPTPWIAIALAALAALALTIANERVDALTAGTWPMAGLRRLPLYLVALGYGPTAGIVAALLFAGIERVQGPVPAAEWVLVLEMGVVGWLAIAPSPRRSRLAAPFGVVAGWTLAMGTAGLAALASVHRPLPPTAWFEAMRADLPGVLAAALLLALPSPRWWRAAAPGAAAGVTGGSAPGADGRTADGAGQDADEGRAGAAPMRREEPRRTSREPAPPRLPPALERAARRPRETGAAFVPEPGMTTVREDDERLGEPSARD